MKAKISEAIAAEAARILAETGSTDIASARRKAAKRLGAANRRNLPDNRRIEEALREYQVLFQGDRQPLALSLLREKAVYAMQLLHRYSPRLVGPVLEGYADSNTPVEIHLFSERCEDVLIELMERLGHWVVDQRMFRYPDGKREIRPLYRIQDEEVEMELICFPVAELRNRAPLNPLDGRPMRRAGLSEIARSEGSK